MKKFWNILLLILMVLILGTAIGSFGGILPEYALPFYTLGFVLLLVWAIKWIASRRVSWVWSPMYVPLLLFVAYALVRYSASPIEHDSRTDLFHIGLYTLIFLLVAQNLYRPRDWAVIAGALIVFALVESGYALWQYRTLSDWVLWLDRSYDYHGRGSGTYYCPNHLAGLLEMALGLVLGWFTVFRRPESLQGATLRRMTELAVIGFIGLGFYTTYSRGGWLSLMAAILAMLVFAEITRTISSRAAIGVFVTFFVLGAVILSLPATQHRLGETFIIDWRYRLDESPVRIRAGFAGRFQLWRSTFGMIHDHPWFGSGPGTWQWTVLPYRIVQNHPEYAHSDGLQLIAEYGIVGFTLITALFACFYWQAVQLARRAELSAQRAFASGALTAVTAILVHSWVDFNLHIPANALVLATLLGLVAAQGNEDRRWRSGVPRWAKPIFALTIVAVAVGGGMVGYIRVRTAQDAARAYDAAQDYEWDDALRLYQHALKLDSRSPELHAQLGDVYATQSEITTNEELAEQRQLFADKAMGEYRQALQFNPDNPDIILKIALTFELTGDQHAAFDWYKRALQLDPKSAANWIQLGSFYIRQGDTNEAVAAWQHAHELMPGDPTSVDLMHPYKPE